MLPVSCPLRTCFSHKYVVRSSSWLPLYQSSITSSYCSTSTSHWHAGTLVSVKIVAILLRFWSDFSLQKKHLLFEVGYFGGGFVPELIGNVHHHVHSFTHQTMKGGEGLRHALQTPKTVGSPTADACPSMNANILLFRHAGIKTHLWQSQNAPQTTNDMSFRVTSSA